MSAQPIDPRALRAAEALDSAGKLAHWPETKSKKQEAARIIQSHFAESVNGRLLGAWLELACGRIEHMRFIIENPKSVQAGFRFSETFQWLDENFDKMKLAASIAQSQPPSMADELAEALRDLTKIGTPQLGTEKLKAIDILARYDAQKGQS